MTRPARLTAIVLTLLSVALFLWVNALLYRFRIANIFDANLMKFLGPWIVFGAMAVCPLAAAILSLRMIRKQDAPVCGRITLGVGCSLFVGFIIYPGAALWSKAFEAKTPANPQTPRHIEPQTGLAVFPGAQGFGTRTPAGRGGKVIEVTSLADDGPGTLRAALDGPSPRIIVFRVSGTIELKQMLLVSHPYVTIAGQTAPGGGICVKNAGIRITTHDVLVQHIRVRPGNQGDVDADDNDAIQILGRHGHIDGAHHVVLDHISASWGEDETVNTWYGAHDITISWSIISEALNKSRHRKGTHSAGLLIGDSSYHVSVHHTLLAHNDFRNPLIAKGGTHDFVNNVIYNWGVMATQIVDNDSNSFLNFVGNYFLPGPSTTEPYEIIIDDRHPGTPQLYVEGNLGPHHPHPNSDEWSFVKYGWERDGVAPETYRSPTRFKTPDITSTSASEALKRVLTEAGATLPRRDAVDTRVVADVVKKTGSIIDAPQDVGGYPKLAGGTPPVDSDHDGMPDDWEKQHGLDANDPSDGNGDLDGDGYTNIEEYLHSLLK